MKKWLPLFFVLFFSLSGSAQSGANPDRIVGYYLAVDPKTGAQSQVEIYRGADNKYYGKIVWLQHPYENGRPIVDSKNPDKELRDRPMLGLPLLSGFVYNPKKDEWDNGSLYNPASGDTYHCYMKFVAENKLKIHGYIGSAWMGLGKNAFWPKENALRK